MVTKKKGLKLFTLEGAHAAYRLLIESMNEGAVTLAADHTIFYANACFARMVKCPLEQVIGASLHRFLAPPEVVELRRRLGRKAKAGAKCQVQLIAGDGTKMAAQISYRPSAARAGQATTTSLVVTDMTAARHSELELRALTHRLLRAQEGERRRVALELHDNITQLLCAVQFRSQALAESLGEGNEPGRQEAEKLRDMLGHTVREVERIAHNLRPSVLEQLGLSAALREACKEFSDRTGLNVKLSCEQLTARLGLDAELAIYRILQVALRNVEQHARASFVTVSLTQQGEFVQLVVFDNGIGFDAFGLMKKPAKKKGFGLLSIRERAAHLGGSLKLTAAHQAGTEVHVTIPLMTPHAATH